jgi:hypothetical protein
LGTLLRLAVLRLAVRELALLAAATTSTALAAREAIRAELDAGLL